MLDMNIPLTTIIRQLGCGTLDIHESEKFSNISSSSTRSGDTECAFERSAEEFSSRKGGLFLFIAVCWDRGKRKVIFFFVPNSIGTATVYYLNPFLIYDVISRLYATTHCISYSMAIRLKKINMICESALIFRKTALQIFDNILIANRRCSNKYVNNTPRIITFY